MNIIDIKGKQINVSAHTITIKNEEGKTAGIVRNVCSLADMRVGLQFELAGKLRKAGVENRIYMPYLDKILVVNGEMYLPVDDHDLPYSERLQAALPELEKGIHIIHCARIHWAAKRK